MASVDVTGLDKVLAKLDKVAALDKLEAPMHRGVLRLEAYMKDYPAAPPLSRYIRTGTLGRRWTTKIERVTNGMIGKVGNNVPYGPFVQSDRFQTRFHRRTGWRTDNSAVRDNEHEIRADFQAVIDAIVRS